jgi:pre-mRNA-splicing factor SYF1
MKLDNSNTALKIIPRYIKLNPDFKEQYADYLKQRAMIDKSVEVILMILND